jgi:ATP-dependent protease HslVU (ClpYQ) peptidase subunit
MSVIRQLSLVKGEERFVFRYQAGQEPEVIDAFAGLAADGRSTFDWFDAAVLSFKLTQSLIGQADELLDENTDAQIHAN